MNGCGGSFFSRRDVWIFSLASLFLAACQATGPQYISHRDPAPIVAAKKIEAPAEPVPAEDPQDLFVRQKELRIRRKAPINETGSLTDLNDPRAYLFGFERPIEIGQFIDVKVASNRADTAAKGDSSAAADGAAADEKSPTKGVDESALLKALPSLEPAGKNKPVLVKNIKMQILERFDNGDVLVMHKRRSIREGQGAEIAVTARLNAETLSRPDQVSTADLADIDWRESTDGELVERKSANWEDEYSLRLSGFDETKSKDAIGLDEKREMLKSARNKLENEMKGFSQERAKMAKERASLLDEKAKDNAKIADLEKQSAELQKKVEDLSPKDEAPTDDSATAAKGGSADANLNDKGAAKAKDAKAYKTNESGAAKAPANDAGKSKPAAKKPTDAAKKG
jgi:hypothetical protein